MRTKKRIIVIATASSIIAGLSLTISNKYSIGKKNFSFKNIEALAESETNNNDKCFGTGSVQCPESNNYVKTVSSNYSFRY